MTDPILSPQEQRIQAEIAGRQILHTRQKTNAILHTFKNTRPRIDIERAKYFTQSFRRTEGEPLLLRWAKALKHIAENITVYIDDHQLLVGRSGSQGRYGILYPELDGDFLGLAIEQIPNRVESPFNISEDDSRTIIEEIAPYWQGKTFHENLAKTLPAETLKYTYDPKDPLSRVSLSMKPLPFAPLFSGYTIMKRF